jgi:hypothetical protein
VKHFLNAGTGTGFAAVPQFSPISAILPTHQCPYSFMHVSPTSRNRCSHASCIVLAACNDILHSATSCVLSESLHVLAEVQHVTTVHIISSIVHNVQRPAGMSPACSVSPRYGNEVRKETALTVCRSAKCCFLRARFRVWS